MAAIADDQHGVTRRAWLGLTGAVVAAMGVVACTLTAASPTAAPTAAVPAGAAPAPKPNTPGSPSPSSQAAQKPPLVSARIKAGYLKVVASGPMFIALDRGYFTEAGVDVDGTAFASATDQIPLLGSGDLSLGNGALSIGLYNSWLRDIRTIVVADGGTLKPGCGSVWLDVATRNAETIKDWKDLRGKKVSVSAEGALVDYVIRSGLRQAGMSIADIEIVRMPQPDSVVAFKTAR